MDNDDNLEVVAEYISPFYNVIAAKQFLVLKKKFPPARRDILYSDISSVEHRKIIDYNALVWGLVIIAIIISLNLITPVMDIFSQLVLEIQMATDANAPDVIDASIRSISQEWALYLSVILAIVAIYFIIKFFTSLSEKLIIYRTGKPPIAVPMKLTGGALEVLRAASQQIKSEKGISKNEVQKIIGDQMRFLLDNRVKTQQQLMASFKAQLKAAKSKTERENLKGVMQESIEKLEEQDRVIDTELRKTGLTKEDIFKKYHIRAPRDQFVDTVLAEGGVDILPD